MSPDTAPSLQIDGARATIRLRRPLEHNRIDPSDLAVLLDHFEQARSNKAVQLEPAVARYVDAIVECEPGVVALMKLHLNQTADGNIDITAQRAAYEQSLRSDEVQRHG